VLSDDLDELEAFEIQKEVTVPLFRRIGCFVCGPANLQSKLIIVTIFNIIVLALVGVMLTFKVSVVPGDQKVYKNLMITSMTATVVF